MRGDVDGRVRWVERVSASIVRRIRAFTGALLAVLLIALLLLTGCSTGNDAAVYGGSFTFVSPGGKIEFSYPPADRGTVGDLSGPNLTGDGTIALSQYKSSVVVLNFWGSWCAPCRSEAEGLNAAASQLADKGVQFLGVDVQDSRQAGADFHASKEVPYPSIFDPTMRTLLSLRGFPTSSMPVTIVLDRQHRVAHIWLTEVNMQQVLTVVSAIAAEGR